MNGHRNVRRLVITKIGNVKKLQIRTFACFRRALTASDRTIIVSLGWHITSVVGRFNAKLNTSDDSSLHSKHESVLSDLIISS